MREPPKMKVFAKIGLDRDSAILYTENPRTRLNRNDVEYLYRQLDQIRRELKMPDRKRQAAKDQFFIKDW